ncbi:MAG: hypothetical protein R3F62_22655 [Planctomycetota bacterium]
MRPTRSDHLSDEVLAARGLSRETDLRLDREGRFWRGPQPVAHPGVAAAFARWLSRTSAGRYALRNDLHYVYLKVEGAPLHARAVRGAPPEPPQLELSGGELEPLRPETLRRDAEGVLYAQARDGTWTVRLATQAALDLGPWLEAQGDDVVLRVADAVYEVPEVPDPLR